MAIWILEYELEINLKFKNMKQKIVAGNWKMNLDFEQADELLFELKEALEDIDLENKKVIVCPPACYLELATDAAIEGNMSVGAQNVYFEESGAYTGEISAMMLESIEVEYCIVGHSERRKYFAESDEIIAKKVDSLLNNGVIPIVCIGEQLEQREKQQHFEVVKSQIEKALFHFEKDEFSNIILAYEPVWAIGTGKTATTAQAQEMHSFIRGLVANKYGQEVANSISILYGGSCNASNAKELFAQADVDGGLIGGASLKINDFLEIIKSV